MSQVHSGRNDKYTEHLAGFMGHLNIYAQNYRLPLDTLQKGIVGSRLIEIEESYKNHEESNIIQNSEIRKEEENVIEENTLEDHTAAEKHSDVNIDVPTDIIVKMKRRYPPSFHLHYDLRNHSYHLRNKKNTIRLIQKKAALKLKRKKLE